VPVLCRVGALIWPVSGARGGDEQTGNSAEVVEDQRLVEVAFAGDRAGSRADDAFIPPRFERCIDDLGARLLAGLVRLRRESRRHRRQPSRIVERVRTMLATIPVTSNTAPIP